MADTTEVVTGDVSPPTALQAMSKFASYLLGRANLDEDDMQASNLETQASIATRILNSTSVDDVFAANEKGTLGGRDIVDLEQEIQRFDIVKSKNADIESKIIGGVFLLVHAINLADGKPFTWNTSASGLVASLVSLERMDAFPIRVAIREAGGKGALRLERLAQRAV